MGGGPWPDGTEGADGGEEAQASLSVKGLAALALFLEAVAGMYLPLLLQRLRSPQWWLSLLNCFSGGIFLSAGIIHLLPHCAEAQEALGSIGPNGADYPLYLVLVVVGYCVVFYVERVLFDVHGEGHAHCQHSNVYSHSSYYKQLSHRNQHHAGMPPEIIAASEPELLFLPGPAVATANHACRGVDTYAEAAAAALGDDECKKKELAGFHGTQTPSGGPDDRLAPHHDHHHDHHDHHGHSHLQPHQHATQSRSQSHSKVGRLPLPTVPNAGSNLQAGVAVGLVGVGLGLDGNDAEDDAESCHSDHPPRAICMCVEEGEAKAEAWGQHHHNHKQQQQRLDMGGADRSQHTDQPGQGSIVNAHCQGSRGSAGGCSPLVVDDRRVSAGGGECDEQLRTPLLAAHAAPMPTPTSPAFAALDGASDVAGDVGGAKGRGELRGMPWQYVQLQQQQQRFLALPLHPPDSCIYHTRHHLHPHHRPRRRSMGPVPVSSCGGGAVDSCASSSCPSLVQTLTPHPTSIHAHPHFNHPHTHDHHHHHHHIIKPRFRFMHGVVLLVALALHTSLECIALGLIDSRSQFLLLFAAIASHKAVSALALSSRFMREGATMAQVTIYVGPFCLVAPVSILAGVYVGRVAPIARLVFSCFATGTFIYVGASEVIMEEFEGEMRADRRDISTRAARYIKFSAVLLAVALVAASGLLPDPDHH
ncbi:hypothetical protein Vafri_7338 [Volvox africanus]|nr:hypothetical protein Vafri_7338 [Volvox africanus]